MTNRAFAVAGGAAIAIANDVGDFRYRAMSVCVPIGIQAEARVAANVEVQIMVEDGFVEFMINGGAAVVLPGDFVRVPPRAVFAYRNAGDEPAHLLMRYANPAPIDRALRIVRDTAA